MPEKSSAPSTSPSPSAETLHANHRVDSADDPGVSLTRDVSISAVTAALFLLLRIFAVSKWDWYTASDVAGTVDFGTAPAIALGTLFAEPTITGVVVMTLLPLVALNLAWPQPGLSQGLVPRLLAVAVLGAVTIALVSTLRIWWLPAGAILIGAILIVVRLAWQHTVAHRTASKLLERAGTLVTIGILALAATISTPWTARESIETTQGSIIGYVLETPSGYLKILTDDDRELIILVSGDIISRHALGD